MTRPIDCVYFGEQLDSLMTGQLPDDARSQLRAHAADCQDCSMALRIQEHLLEPSLESIQAEAVCQACDKVLARRVQEAAGRLAA